MPFDLDNNQALSQFCAHGNVLPTVLPASVPVLMPTGAVFYLLYSMPAAAYKQAKGERLPAIKDLDAIIEPAADTPEKIDAYQPAQPLPPTSLQGMRGAAGQQL